MSNRNKRGKGAPVKEKDNSLKIIIISVLVSVAVIIGIVLLTSIKFDKAMYDLGDYEITESEYRYLLGMYKRNLLEELGYTEEQIGYTMTNEMTLGEYMDFCYMAEFKQSVYSLLYSQALFDEYGLSLTEQEMKNINASVDAVVAYLGERSEDVFDMKAKHYGFSADTLRSVYVKQTKESRVIAHLYGNGYQNISEKDKELFYKENYLHFQVLVVNTLYKIHKDSQGNETVINLSESEKNYKLQLEKELRALLVDENMDYDYVILKDDKNLSYDELWKKYSDDTVYEGGYYMRKPSAIQLQTSNTLSAAQMLAVGDCGVVKAKKFFTGSGTINGADGKEQIKEGDYFEYGSAFILKLELDDGAYQREENKDFFPEATFLSTAAQSTYFNTLKKYEEESFMTLNVHKRVDDYNFTNVLANDLDYNILHADDE